MRLFNFENNKVENKRTSSPLTAKHLTRSAAVQSNGQLFPIFFFLYAMMLDEKRPDVSV